MGLSDSEKELLERLTKKSKEPDAPPVSKSISANIDLGDDKQVERAIEHGFLTRAEVKALKEGDDNGDDDKGNKSTATPRRKGSYFKDGDE
jgi:hypothetical protein